MAGNPTARRRVRSAAQHTLARGHAVCEALTALAAAGLVAVAGLTAALLPGTAQAEAVIGNGQAATEQRSTGAAIEIETSSLDVTLRQGPTPRIELRADANLLALIQTEVVDGDDGPRLQIRWKPEVSLRARTDPQVTVTMPDVRLLSIQGSGSVSAQELKTPSLAAHIVGSGDIRLRDLDTQTLKLHITGSGDIRASGKAPKVEIRIAGSGDVATHDLMADDVSVAIAGSGDAGVHASRTLSVSISGSGDVVYSGQPKVTQSTSGSGSIRSR